MAACSRPAGRSQGSTCSWRADVPLRLMMSGLETPKQDFAPRCTTAFRGMAACGATSPLPLVSAKVGFPLEPTPGAGIERRILSSEGETDRASLAARGVQLLSFPPPRLMR